MADDTKRADSIAHCVIEAFDALPANRKPRGPASGLGTGRREWVPLAGVVLENIEDPTHALKCVAFATGMKCLPENRIASACGNVLHDSHAEVLALRAFNRFLLDECVSIARSGTASRYVESTRDLSNDSQPFSVTTSPTINDQAGNCQRPFRIRSSIRIHMYCSEAPCGDASMELIMSQQDDPTPWTSKTSDEKSLSNELLGRGYFGELGVVRRKPSRPDAPPTLSKSCSDKITLKQFTSTLSGITSMFVDPANAYLETLIIPLSQLAPQACERAFSLEGRLANLPHVWRDTSHSVGNYAFRSFQLCGCSIEFKYSRRLETGISTVVPSNLSAVVYGQVQEILINGVLQGRKQTDPKGASALSRRRMWQAAATLANDVACQQLIQLVTVSTYEQLQMVPSLHSRTALKSQIRTALPKGWVRNIGDEQWGLGTA